MTTIRPDLRERRRQATREEICRLAMDLVLERGFAQVTVEDIAAAAGISVRTFFNYFPSKKYAVIPGPGPLPADAVERFVADTETPLLDGLLALLTGLVAESIDVQEQIRRCERAIEANPELVHVMHERMTEFEASAAEAIRRRLGADPDDDRPAVLAAACTAMGRVAMTVFADDSFDRGLTKAFTVLRGSLDG